MCFIDSRRRIQASASIFSDLLYRGHLRAIPTHLIFSTFLDNAQSFPSIIPPCCTVMWQIQPRMRYSSETTPRPVLPTELWDQIIDGVADIIDFWDSEMLQRRNNTLHACSLVARSWVPRSQTQLFRYVFLNSEVRATKLVEALYHLPALGRLVDVLIIRPKIYQDSEKWIYHALSTLPLSLPCLRKLAFRDFSSLDPSSIILTSHFSKVESLELAGSTEKSLARVVQFANQIPQLRKLNLRSCAWMLGSQCDNSKKHNLTTLSTAPMHTQCEEELLEWAIASGSTYALTTFRANSSGSGSTMDRVVQTCRSTLRELHLYLQSPLGGEKLGLGLIAPFLCVLTNYICSTTAYKSSRLAASCIGGLP